MKKGGRQSTNVEDIRSGQSFGSALIGGLRQMGTAFHSVPKESIQDLSNKFTKSGNPAGQELPKSPDYHNELRKGF